MTLVFRRFLKLALHRELLLDLEDRLAAEAVKAHEMVRDHSGLRPKKARELVGQARFRMMEQGYEDVCALHGGSLLSRGMIPRSDLQVFQPFMRFEIEGQGVILGLSAMTEAGKIPVKNKSRLAGVTLNYDLEPTLDFNGQGPKIGDIFAMLLVSRDRGTPGQLEEIAVGIVDAKYASFLFYESLGKFLADEDHARETPTPGPAPLLAPGVTLKRDVKPFVPPEAPKKDKEEGIG